MNENKLLKLNVTHLPLENNPFSLKIYKLFIIYFVVFLDLKRKTEKRNREA